MSRRVLGFVLVAVGIVSVLAAFGTAKDYQPRLGIVNATQRAYVWTNCTPTPRATFSNPLAGTPIRSGWYEGTCNEYDRRNYFTISLAGALIASIGVGLAGLGLIAFGKEG